MTLINFSKIHVATRTTTTKRNKKNNNTPDNKPPNIHYLTMHVIIQARLDKNISFLSKGEHDHTPPIKTSGEVRAL